MHDNAILYPVFALAAWTSLVLLQIPIARFRSAFKREVEPNDFKYGESARVPHYVSIPNRNYMNLLEAPMLFYVVCVIAFVSGTATPVVQDIAWVYVALRVLHSVIHLSYNKVIHRLLAFALSNFTLIALWVVVGLNVLPRPAA